MITLKNVKTAAGDVVTHTIESPLNHTIDGMGRLLMLPALVDVDSHYSNEELVPHSERCIRSGISRLFDGRGKSPKELMAMTTPELIGPLSLFHYIDGSRTDEYDSIGRAKNKCIGIKANIDLGTSPATVQQVSTLDRLFQIAAQENLIVTLSLVQGKGSHKEQKEFAFSTIVQAITLAEKYSNQLCLQHLRTAEEVTLIKEAKENGILVYGEIAYPHLFIHERSIEADHAAKMQYFLPTSQDQEALWKGINDRTIDMIGSGNLLAPPELFLPLLMHAVKTNQLRLEVLSAATRLNSESIFRLPPNKDIILVDMETAEPFPQQLIEELHLSPEFKKLQLTGWTKFTIAHEQLISSKG